MTIATTPAVRNDLLVQGFTERLAALPTLEYPANAPSLYEVFDQLADGSSLFERDQKIVNLIVALEPEVKQTVVDLFLAFYATYQPARAEETIQEFRQTLYSASIPPRIRVAFRILSTQIVNSQE